MTEENKPRLVETGSGFSILQTVEYKGRLLYSKYSPTRAIKSLLEKTDILPSTLVLINSPCLFYGLDDLIKKCPQSCAVLALEDDENLFDLAQKSLDELKIKNPNLDFSSVNFFSTKNLLKIDDFIRDCVNGGSIRRVISLDFSAGKSFNPQVYNLIFSAAQEIIATFWKNRITLVKMGRLFSKNMMENLKSFDGSRHLNQVKHSVSLPILVCAAGESLDFTFEKNSAVTKLARENKFFTIAVDACMTSLFERNIPVDSVVALESQFAIQKAYIGHKNLTPLFFADLCSRPQVQKLYKKNTVWFSSQFTEARFLGRIKGLGVDFIPPLGSVGLAAVYIALLLRKDESIPVFVTGLDFSYSIGKTHAKNTPAHKQRLNAATRLIPIENFDAAFSDGNRLLIGKNKKTVSTSPIMISYRQNFENYFSKQKNLFDIGKTGLNLNLEILNDKNFFSAFDFSKNLQVKKIYTEPVLKKNSSENAKDFLEEESAALEKVRDLLSNGEKSAYFKNTESLSQQIKNLLLPREYLYLHFPDGYSFSLDEGFLKRVRAQIDFFLKIMKTPKK